MGPLTVVAKPLPNSDIYTLEDEDTKILWTFICHCLLVSSYSSVYMSELANGFATTVKGSIHEALVGDFASVFDSARTFKVGGKLRP